MLKNKIESVNLEEISLEETFNMLDQNLKDHSHRVAELSIKLARLLDEDINEIELYKAALYHDIGKIMICRSIRDKPAKLTKEEMEVMKLHAKYSAKIVSNNGESDNVVLAIMLHHENYDGSGYPFKYIGDRTPINSRIIRIADSYAALNAKRSYKEAFIIDKCIEILERESHMYDPKLLKTFIEKII